MLMVRRLPSFCCRSGCPVHPYVQRSISLKPGVKFHVKHHQVGGKGFIRVLGRLDWNSGYNGNYSSHRLIIGTTLKSSLKQ